MIPAMPYGAPATSVTVPVELAQRIETRAIALEATGMRDLARSPKLAGSWRLLYTNGLEITNLEFGVWTTK